MSETMRRYRRVDYPLPARVLSWRLFGAGMEQLGCQGRPCQEPMPVPGPDELVARVDAVGLCFSDVKLIALGPDHPRIQGRDLQADPTIPGHEAALTLVAVGEHLRGQYRPGDRFIVQADVIYQGVPQAYGYALPGALCQFTLIPRAILEGDEGNYLLPVAPDTGYAEAALVEPWACVTAAYRIAHRTAPKPGGISWLVAMDNNREWQISRGLEVGSHPRKVVASGLRGPLLAHLESLASRTEMELAVVELTDEPGVSALCQDHADGVGFDDVIIFGRPRAELVEAVMPHLARFGVVNITADEPLARPVTVDVGRVHYDGIAYLGSTGEDAAAGYRAPRRGSELEAGGAAWFIGAGGPMGQMHVQRAAGMPDGPSLIVATDIDSQRLALLRDKFEPTAQRAGRRLLVLNPNEHEPARFRQVLLDLTEGEGFDDVVVMVPVPALIEEGAGCLAAGGVLNIFAGVARGTMARLDLSRTYRQGVRWAGSSGSRIVDLQDTLALSQEGVISTNLSVAAVGGISAAGEGLQAVKEGRFPGKTVIFPQLDFPLWALPELEQARPEVYQRLGPGKTWSQEAEQALFESGLHLPHPTRHDGGCHGGGLLAGKAAIVTGGGQGIGAALCHRLAREGARVMVVDLNGENAAAVAAELEGKYAVAARCCRADVSSQADMEAMAQATLEAFGSIDILVANAGVLFAGGIDELEPSRWRAVVEVNLVGYYLAARAVVPAMKRQGAGVIIQINSKSGKKGSFRNSAYAASKFGGLGLTQSLALELAAEGIRVNAICPGNLLDSPLWVDSLYEQYAERLGVSKEEVRRRYEEQVPLGRGCSYDDVANVVVFLASEQASYLTGQAINVTGGQEMR